MPERILYLLLGEADRRSAERQRQVDSARGGKPLSAFMAIPPFLGD